MGQVHFEKIDLQQLVVMSPLIVMAREESNGKISRTFLPACGIEPYVYVDTRYRVIEVLLGTAELSPGAEIIVTGFDPGSLKVHLDYHVQGLSRSPEVPAYDLGRELRPDAAEGCILFLKRRIFLLRDIEGKLCTEVDALAHPCWNALESMDKKKMVRSLIKTHAGKSSIEVTIGVSRESPADSEIGLIEQIKSMFPHYTSYSWKVLNISPERL